MSSNPEIKQLLNSLRHALLGGRLAHAYLLCGRSREVLREAAGEILALLYCKAPPPESPCGECPGCRQALARQHPDSLWIEPESKSRRVVVDQIDRLLQHIGQTTFDGGWKTVVLADADRLNEQASNKILKTLEEPPPRSLFLLLTDSPDELLSTIISRCQRLTLNSADPEASREGRDLILAAMTETGGGGLVAAMERARFILDRLKAIKAEIGEIEAGALAEMNLDDMDKSAREKMEAVMEARIEARYRGRRETVLEWLLLWQRDLLMCIAGADDALLAFQDAAATLRQAAQGLNCRQALARLRVVEEMQTQFERNIHEAMVFEHGFVRLAAPGAA